MTWIDLTLALISLVMKIWDQIATAKAAAKKEKIQFDLDQAQFLDYAQKAVEIWRNETAEDNRNQQSGQDKVDAELRKIKKGGTKPPL